MNKKNTITIGVPAFNEEVNIGNLIKDILNQQEANIYIEKIIIVSDGSTDDTVEIAKRFEDKRIRVLNNIKRCGLAEIENQIINLVKSDVLVILNADTRIKDKKFIAKLTLPIIQKKADLIASRIREVEPEGFFEKILLTSMRIKDVAYEEFKGGNNVYTCHGQARAFSKKLYKNLSFPSSVGEDAYSYFFCIKEGYIYKYVNSTNIFYRLPTNLMDHQMQSLRFFQSQKLLASIFGEKIVDAEYSIPKTLIFKSIIKTFNKFPFHTVIYLSLVVYLKIKSRFSNKIGNMWDISKSSKKLPI